ncbi:manganese/zinc/iron transport system permease protein [Anoxybacillus calidus]|jgi:manganese/zinc/iron transport system permease protein|uniref:Manganese/zinc/iron transport system permease protein n=1 Tax=[Anoxybacillus] calidus TaxID=575178 RepID=A0A7V9YXL8_9BACL|nr:metal ABC transporter permease [Anoxybacillus calidus]MBA2870303.1 manganese/zinc/iron transport system permease protein [Anoxybacillus calidus]
MSYEGWILLTGSLVGISCGIVGCFLILRKMAMLADAISHTVLLGIVGAYLISNSLEGIYMLIGAAIVGILTAFFVQLLHSSGVQSDAAIGVVFTSLFAVGVILLSLFAGKVHLDTDHALMGEITFIPWDILEINGINLGPKAVWMLGAVLVFNLIIIFLFYKEIKISSFDPDMAVALGIPVLLIHYLLMGMLSLTTVASFDGVGAILVVAMLIVPGATAYLLTDKLSVMLIISAIVGVLSAFAGYFIATIFNVSISGSMAVAAGVIFAITFVFSPTHGLLSRWLARKRLQNKSA